MTMVERFYFLRLEINRVDERRFGEFLKNVRSYITVDSCFALLPRSALFFRTYCLGRCRY